jgi:hypothetical protein
MNHFMSNRMIVTIHGMFTGNNNNPDEFILCAQIMDGKIVKLRWNCHPLFEAIPSVASSPNIWDQASFQKG